MTAQPKFENRLIDRLPEVRGRYTENADLSKTSWFQVGGPAEVLFKPADVKDLQLFMKGCPKDVPITVFGVCSNVIIRDGGVPGVVIRLGREFATMEVDSFDTELINVGAAALDANVAIFAQKNGISGLEFLSGIPGSIGAGIFMNAGCYGFEFCDVLVSAIAVDRHGVLHNVTPDQIKMEYRKTKTPEGWIYVGASLGGEEGDADEIKTAMEGIKKQREDSQPIREKTGGSTFANPSNNSAWKVIDAAGCRGLTIGGAQMSEHHCNFMINTGDATAADLENLGEEVRKRVKADSGINLRWEIKRIGEPSA